MTGYVSTGDGQVLELPTPLSWTFEYTAGTPCDSFHLVCPWDRDGAQKPGTWSRFFAREGERRVFTGVVDECEYSLSPAGSRLEVNGRGMAALLLDNEALGQDYLTAAPEDILRDHVTPYGIRTAPGNPALPGVERFSVAAGSSEWAVVYAFARYHGGVSPRFNRQGELVLAPWEDKTALLIDDATPVTRMLRRDRRYGVLSQVWVRERYENRVERLENSAFQAQGGQCRRVVTMPGRSDYPAMRYSGQFQLERSASEQVRLEVDVPILFYGQPGDLVRVNRSGWGSNGEYRVFQARVETDENGGRTRLELGLPQAVV